MGPEPCPCGSGLAFSGCCQPLLEGLAAAPTAQALMRSRYSAYVVADESYLLATWHPETRPSRVRLDESQRWLGLKIIATQAGAADDQRGTVEFVARCKSGGRAQRLHERSRFERIDGRWFYRDGDHL